MAEATINIAQGITKALTLPPPASWAQAAAVAAAGAAQIATIASAKKGSASKPSVSGAGAAAASQTAAAPAADAGPSANITIYGDSLGRKGIEDLVKEINKLQRDRGGNLNLRFA